jgi:hypothetical protein
VQLIISAKREKLFVVYGDDDDEWSHLHGRRYFRRRPGNRRKRARQRKLGTPLKGALADVSGPSGMGSKAAHGLFSCPPPRSPSRIPASRPRLPSTRGPTLSGRWYSRAIAPLVGWR